MPWKCFVHSIQICLPHFHFIRTDFLLTSDLKTYKYHFRWRDVLIYHDHAKVMFNSKIFTHVYTFSVTVKIIVNVFSDYNHLNVLVCYTCLNRIQTIQTREIQESTSSEAAFVIYTPWVQRQCTILLYCNVPKRYIRNELWSCEGPPYRTLDTFVYCGNRAALRRDPQAEPDHHDHQLRLASLA